MKKIEKMIKNNIDLKTNYQNINIYQNKYKYFFKYIYICVLIIILVLPTILSDITLKDNIIINELENIDNISNHILDSTMYMKDMNSEILDADLNNLVPNDSINMFCDYDEYKSPYCIYKYSLNNFINVEVEISKGKRINKIININKLKESNIDNTKIYIIKLPNNYISIFNIDKINFIVKTNENDYNNHIDVVKKIIGG